MADQPTDPSSTPGTTPSDRPSGSRWEPGADDTPTSERRPEAPVPVGPPPTDAPDDVTEVAGAGPVERSAQLRGRAILAGAATALTLGGGVAGFAIGHSTAGNGTDGFRPANFSGPQPGQLGEGRQGPPSFDRDGDGDRFGQQPPDLDGDGSSGSDSSNSGSSGSGSSGGSSGSGSGSSANPT